MFPVEDQKGESPKATETPNSKSDPTAQQYSGKIKVPTTAPALEATHKQDVITTALRSLTDLGFLSVLASDSVKVRRSKRGKQIKTASHMKLAKWKGMLCMKPVLYIREAAMILP